MKYAVDSIGELIYIIQVNSELLFYKGVWAIAYYDVTQNREIYRV